MVLLGKSGRAIPSILDYEKHIKAESMYNTPAVFAVYTCLLTLQWLKNMGGIAAVEKVNEAKANLLYSEIDRNPLFIGTADQKDRSNMNATFLLVDEKNQETFDKMWKDAAISGITGHRSVGGYRASMYNALPLESVQVLVAVLKKFLDALIFEFLVLVHFQKRLNQQIKLFQNLKLLLAQLHQLHHHEHNLQDQHCLSSIQILQHQSHNLLEKEREA